MFPSAPAAPLPPGPELLPGPLLLPEPELLPGPLLLPGPGLLPELLLPPGPELLPGLLLLPGRRLHSGTGHPQLLHHLVFLYSRLQSVLLPLLPLRYLQRQTLRQVPFQQSWNLQAGLRKAAFFSFISPPVMS